MVRRIKVTEVARFGDMTVFETDSLEDRTMRILYNPTEDKWYISDTAPEDMASHVLTF